MSRWEQGATRMGVTADRLLRLMVASHHPVREYPLEVMREVAKHGAKPIHVRASVVAKGDMIAEATGPDGAIVTFEATASPHIDAALTSACAPVSGSTFALGQTMVTCSATDSANNAGSAVFTVTVQ